MFSCICKKLQYGSSVVKSSPRLQLYFHQNHPLSSSSTILESISNTANEHSFTVSYLINSCGFSLEKALSASKDVNFEAPDKPDSVLNFFKNHGFTETQISNMTNRDPSVLLCDPRETLLPKFDFFQSKGISNLDIAKMLSSTPSILRRSLENQIIPSFDFFKNWLESDDDTVFAIKRFHKLLLHDLQTYVAPNIEILRELGVPESNLVVLLKYHPRVFMTKSDRFKEIVEEVKKIGINPITMKFVQAVQAMRGMSRLTWKKKVELYKKWGWSENDVLTAFGKHPWCMTASEDKIMGVMDFLVSKMGLDSSVIARRPDIISLSLDKRIVPRCSVYQALLEKGLITKDFSLRRMLESTEQLFLKKFVECFEEEASELLKLYQEKLELSVYDVD
ncbi:unnamed protein product [Ilex paraguariensis]|uniref:Uncharacterized protein n=1 Tax=Ilex paraguariensis TaxID=185542 RepID=A0ABC8SRG6_9AQUA